MSEYNQQYSEIQKMPLNDLIFLKELYNAKQKIIEEQNKR